MIISGTLVLALVLTTGIAFAANDYSIGPIRNPLTQEQRDVLNSVRKEVTEEAMTYLVANGTLTQEDADEFIANADKAPTRPEGFKRNSEISDSIASEEMEALRTKSQDLFEFELDKLVKAGTITEEIASQLKEQRPMNQGRVKNRGISLTEDQITAVTEAREKSFTEALSALASDGTITQEVKDQIQSFHENNILNKGEFRGNRGKMGLSTNLTSEQMEAIKTETDKLFKEKIEDLVSNGAISEEVVDHYENMPLNKGNRRGLK